MGVTWGSASGWRAARAPRTAPAVLLVAMCVVAVAGCNGDDELASTDAVASQPNTSATVPSVSAVVDSAASATTLSPITAANDGSARTTPPSTVLSATTAAGTTGVASGETTATTAGATDESSADVTAPSQVAPVTLVPGDTIARALDDDVAFGTGVLAAITAVEPIEVTGRAPGERSGPGVAVTVEISNRSDETISLDAVIVDLIGADGASAPPIEPPERVSLGGELMAGESANGQYLFFIPADQRASATITVSYAADVPTALFTGPLPNE